MPLHRENVIRAAEKYVARGKLEAAIREYRKVLAENPNDANTLNRVGDLYARIERFDEAVKLFSQIAEQYTRDGFFVKAIAIYKKIIKLDPTSLAVYERLAELYHKQGLLNEARTQYQVLADYYQKHDNTASAITIYLRMAEIDPENPSFHLKLAELFESQRLIEKAMKEYRFLADLLLVGGSVEEAVQVYFKALEVSSDDLEFVRDVVSGLHDVGHVGEAARVLARAVELNPAATGLAQQVGLRQTGAQRQQTGLAMGEVGSSAVGPASGAFDTDDAFADDTFLVPEASFDEIQETLEETHASAAAAAEEVDTGLPDEGEIFTFDLDDDEVPASLVKPPADMLEADGTDIDTDIDIDDDEAFDLGTIDPTEAALEAGDTVTGEIEIDWPLDEMMDLDLPETAAEEASGGEHEIELDATLPAQREKPQVEPLELEAFEIGDLSLDLVEHEIELDLEPIELEPGPDLAGTLTGEPAEATIATGDLLADDETEIRAVDERREEDLLAEAKVFAKYGLQEKARDRLSELFQIRPDHLEGLDLQARIELEAEQHEEVFANANLVARTAQRTGQLELWNALRQTLADAGYTVGKDRVLRVPGAKSADDDRIAQLLEDLSLEAYDTPVVAHSSDEIPIPGRHAARSTRASPGSTAADGSAAGGEAPASEPSTVEEESAEELVLEPSAADAKPADKPKKGGKKLISLIDELGLDELELDDEVAAPSPVEADAAVPVEAQPADLLDDTGTSWLDDLETADQAAPSQEETIFDEEDDFFDLAAELERELTEDEGEGAGNGLQGQEQSLEEIIEGFKQGVAEHLSPDDYDTHFNLGIAYREMGLLDEAIGEFQLAAKDDRYVVDSSSLLGMCFLEKGLPELAVRSYRKGLESPLISDHATLGLLYDMATAYLSLGDSASAYKTFIEVYGRNSHYRDVATRIEELKAGS